jgi:hypothetical protein
MRSAHQQQYRLQCPWRYVELQIVLEPRTHGEHCETLGCAYTNISTLLAAICRTCNVFDESAQERNNRGLYKRSHGAAVLHPL